MIKKLALGIVSLGLMTAAGYAASNASDNAGNYGGNWTGGQGTGWGGDWVFQDGPTNSGHFIGDSTTNAGGSLGINSTGDGAWGLFANTGDTANATRPFNGDLSIGQTFSIQIDQGYQDTGSTVGLSLQNSSGQTLFEIYYIGGGTNTWKTNDASGQQDLSPSIPFQR